MPSDEVDLKGLTRALLLGASLGTLPIAIVGCTTSPEGGMAAQPAAAAAEPMRAGPTQSELMLCEAALATKDPRRVGALLFNYPSATCIPSVLAAMPPQVLAQISPQAVARISPEIKRRLSPRVAQQLRLPPTTAAAAPPTRPAQQRPTRPTGAY
jgi:hypothetical protein